MKDFIYVILIVMSGILSGCAPEDEYSSNPYNGVEQGEPEGTIQMIESQNIEGTIVEIFMAKGHEYVSTYKGGLVHSESCPNSKHVRSELENRMSN